MTKIYKKKRYERQIKKLHIKQKEIYLYHIKNLKNPQNSKKNFHTRISNKAIKTTNYKKMNLITIAYNIPSILI